LSTVFYLQTDSQTEQQNQTVKVYLCSYYNNKLDNWAKILSSTEFLYNNSKYSTTEILLFCTATGTDLLILDKVDSQVPESKVPAARERILEIVQVRTSLEQYWQAAVQ
jgi:hypothetical protein